MRDVEAVVRRFKTDLHNCVGYIQDPKLLKESIRALYQKHVQEDIVSVEQEYFIYFCYDKDLCNCLNYIAEGLSVILSTSKKSSKCTIYRFYKIANVRNKEFTCGQYMKISLTC